jgi:prepilin-type N-terminal cleavage/methylation domain-containing protein
MLRIATVTPRARRVPRAFTLAEVIVATAILAIVASIVISTDHIVSSNDRERYDAAADTLNRLAMAITYSDPTNAQTSFRWVIQRHPRKLSQLTKPILTTDTDICGFTYASTTYTNRWVNPFWAKELRTTGTTLVKGFDVQDNLGTFPDANLGFYNSGGTLAASPTALSRRDGIISIRMPSVSLTDAQGLDAAVDGTVNGTAGIIRYSAATDPTSVDYYIMVTAASSTAC